MAEPGSSLLGLKPPLHSLGPADFGQLSQESLNHHQSLLLHFYLCLLLRDFFREGSPPSWGTTPKPRQPKKHLVT